MRLVDADVFAEKMKGVYEEYMWDVLDETPTIDAEPVIRCKDCKYFYTYVDGEGECDFHDWYRADPTENDYCSRAERR